MVLGVVIVITFIAAVRLLLYKKKKSGYSESEEDAGDFKSEKSAEPVVAKTIAEDKKVESVKAPEPDIAKEIKEEINEKIKEEKQPEQVVKDVTEEKVSEVKKDFTKESGREGGISLIDFDAYTSSSNK